jgi:2-iminoacetate synthase ThiH
MSRFLDDAIARAGLASVASARRSGRLDEVRATMDDWRGADLLALGALADAAREDDVGREVHVHEATSARGASPGEGVLWVDEAPSDLDLLRAVAVARIAGGPGARVGVDWSRHGLELAQVALGFGASDLRGAVTKKSGLPILASDARKVKGEGMVDLAALKRREIAALVRHAGRVAVFDAERSAPLATEEVHAHA